MRRKALFIGVNKYTNGLPELSCAANDATALQEFFEDCGYETCILRNADTNSILSAIEEQTKDLKRNDVFLFFFAGHGYTVGNSDQTLDRRLAGRTDRHSRIMTGQDGIRLDEIRQSVSETHCSCVIIMDACQSMVNTRRAEGMVREACTARDLQAITSVLSRGDRVGSDNGFVVINSCQEGDVAYELNEENHGLFTLSLLDVIRQMRLNGENAAFDESFTQKVAMQMAIRSHGRFSQRPAYLPDRRSLNRIRIFPTAEEIDERHRLNGATRMEEQRRIAAIRAKEEQLAREEKRIWEERIRQEAVLLAEKQKLIERERMREGEGFAGGLQDGQDGFKRKNDSQDEAHDRLVCCPKCDNITDARTCEVCGRALNPQLDNKVKYYTGHASLKTILLLRQHKIEEWTHKRERGVIMRGLDVICGLWPLWLILSMSGACLWLLLYWRHLLEME